MLCGIRASWVSGYQGLGPSNRVQVGLSITDSVVVS